MDHLPSPHVVRASDVLSLSDDELRRLCAASRDLRIERDADGNRIFTPPSGGFASRPLCPDFVVELCSPTDQRATVREKMDQWMADGFRLGTEMAGIYRADGRRDQINSFDAALSGEDILPGFELHLHRLR